MPIARISLPEGETIPALGQGTWMMGDAGANRAREIAALQRGIELGMVLIDTAEMYAGGGAEEVTGEAIRHCREDVFLVSKVLPSNASRNGTIAACERSLGRLGVETIDLYLLHWRGPHPLEETIAGFEALRAAGKIRHWGVSNFDAADMTELSALSDRCAVNQILYNPGRRGPEFDLAPWLRQHGIPLMAYSPIEQGRLARHRALGAIAARHNASAAQIALAWVLAQPNVVAIPKASGIAHVEANRAAADIVLTARDLADIDAAFPPPRRASPLDMI